MCRAAEQGHGLSRGPPQLLPRKGGCSHSGWGLGTQEQRVSGWDSDSTQHTRHPVSSSRHASHPTDCGHGPLPCGASIVAGHCHLLQTPTPHLWSLLLLTAICIQPPSKLHSMPGHSPLLKPFCLSHHPGNDTGLVSHQGLERSALSLPTLNYVSSILFLTY